MRMSCWAWVEGVLGRDADLGARAILPIGRGYYTEPVRSTDWPLPVRGTPYRVVLVIRQWVEEEPEEALARLLEDEPCWDAAVQVYRSGEISDEAALLTNGLPANPAMTAYLRARAESSAKGSDSVLPARGGLVTSVVLQAAPDGPPLHDQVVSSLTCTEPWSTDGHRRQASRVMGQHTEWWAAHPLGNYVRMDLRRCNRRPPDPLSEDIRKCLRGHLTEEQVEERELARQEQLLGRKLLPSEKQRVRAGTQRRLRTARRRFEL